MLRTLFGLTLVISLMVMQSLATATENELTCTVCVDIVTAIGRYVQKKLIKSYSEQL